LIVTFGVT